MTLIEAIKAADELAKENIHIRVLDPFTLKPIDKEAIIKHSKACGGKILTVEDHYIEGNVSKTVYISSTLATFSRYAFSRLFWSDASF